MMAFSPSAASGLLPYIPALFTKCLFHYNFQSASKLLRTYEFEIGKHVCDFIDDPEDDDVIMIPEQSCPCDHHCIKEDGGQAVLTETCLFRFLLYVIWKGGYRDQDTLDDILSLVKVLVQKKYVPEPDLLNILYSGYDIHQGSLSNDEKKLQVTNDIFDCLQRAHSLTSFERSAFFGCKDVQDVDSFQAP
ncbi:unnamed protein product [Sphagnum jensenii]|uniref:Uncharacterized protein n=2 Tax=Sphagnum jensenii TaxID=128206 RepID=A0ABP0VHJ3_9BRYO